jgi:arginase family enzyme
MYILNHLPFKNLYYVGIRDLDQFETETIEKHNIKYTLSKDVNKNPKTVYDQLSLFINKSPVHISFDVDAIDPKYISTTGTPVPNGLEIEAAKELLDLIMKNEFVVALDIVEMNVEVDPDNKDKSLMNFKYSVKIRMLLNELETKNYLMFKKETKSSFRRLATGSMSLPTNSQLLPSELLMFIMYLRLIKYFL